MSVVYEVNLENRTPPHDKVYVIQIHEDSGKYEVLAYYGKRGAKLREERKGSHRSLMAATAEADALADTKIRSKGYSPAGSVPGSIPPRPASSSTAAPASASAIASLAPEVALFEASDVDSFFTRSDVADYCFLQKYDGERRFVVLTTAGAYGFNRERKPVPIAASIEAELRAVVPLSATGDKDGVQAAFDGELMLGDKYIAFDLLHWGLHRLTERAFEERYALLEDVLASLPAMLAPAVWSAKDGVALLETARASRWEGLVARRMDIPYVPGRSAAGYKLKLWESATCEVLAHNSTKSVSIGMLEAGRLVPKGNVTIGGSIPLPEVGAIIEVKYLYCHLGGSLYQPSYLGERSDKSIPDEVSTLKLPPPERTV